ncbi:MAG: hypothetical protein IKS77_03155, partial [Spirochaetales bacterium]|nr:hypothetical protein [Spirochaetales bacterium]
MVHIVLAFLCGDDDGFLHPLENLLSVLVYGIESDIIETVNIGLASGLFTVPCLLKRKVLLTIRKEMVADELNRIGKLDDCL